MELGAILSGLDLKSKEAAVYGALLETGEAAVSLVAKKTGIKRPTAYAVLKTLEGKGFVSRAIRGKRMLFSPLHPRMLVTEAEIRLKQLKEAVPQLESLMQISRKHPRVMIYEGKDALDRAYDDMFITKGEILYIGNVELTQQLFERTYKKLDYIGFGPDFRGREIFPKSIESVRYSARSRGAYRQHRFLPEKFMPFAADICIYGDTVIVTSIKDEYFCVKIESAENTHAFRCLFEAMWMISTE